MISNIFNTVLYEPIYNGLIFLIDVLPWADLGLVIIFLTLIIKFILFPLSLKAVQTQQKTKKIQPKIKELQDKYSDDREKLATELMTLYRENDVKPFSGFLILIIQIPIVLALYWVILRGGLPEVDPSLLYSFVSAPETINVMFLGAINVTQKSIVLALITGATQYVQTKFAFGKNNKKDDDYTLGSGSIKDDMKKTFTTQMKYIFPVVVTVIAYSLSAAIALYWATSNIFHILQEIYVSKVMRKNNSVVGETALNSTRS